MTNEESQKKAVAMFTQAADLGNRAAMRNLAFAYHSGIGAERNADEAEKWFKKAKDLGDPEAVKFRSISDLGFSKEE